MQSSSNIIDAFYALLRAGLWENSVRLSQFSPIDFDALYKLAEEQSVVGLIAAGLEHVEDMTLAKQQVMPFMKRVIALESRNASMNSFIANLFTKLQDAGIRALLVKGQGIAQCYERPQWRSAGDVDFFLDEYNYNRAKNLLIPWASHVDREVIHCLHLGMTIDSWTVELHGTMHTELSFRLNRSIDAIQQDIFQNEGVRIWRNGQVDVLLPSPDNDALLIFTHYIQHFFVGGVGLRQISDWCRLLWTYRDQIDKERLRNRLEEMGLFSEWKAFAHFAVHWLGMPTEAMPFYSTSSWLFRKSRRICRLILKTGNFGHNLDHSYRYRYPKPVEKTITFFRRCGEFFSLSLIFPADGPRFFLTYVFRRTKAIL